MLCIYMFMCVHTAFVFLVSTEIIFFQISHSNHTISAEGFRSGSKLCSFKSELVSLLESTE